MKPLPAESRLGIAEGGHGRGAGVGQGSRCPPQGLVVSRGGAGLDVEDPAVAGMECRPWRGQ